MSMEWGVWKPQVRYDGPAGAAACPVPADSSAECTAQVRDLLSSWAEDAGFYCEALDQAISQETAPSFGTDSHNELEQLV